MSMDAETGAVAQAVKAALLERYGDRFVGVYVFGSRARGDHRADSDLDMAVILRDLRAAPSIVDRELLDVIYPLEIERGLHIQAWAVPAEAMQETAAAGPSRPHDRPDENRPGLRARLAAAVRREGVAL